MSCEARGKSGYIGLDFQIVSCLILLCTYIEKVQAFGEKLRMVVVTAELYPMHHL